MSVNANVGLPDAICRIVLSLGLFAVSSSFHDFQLFSLTAALVAVILLVTALTGTCPIYRALGISSLYRVHHPTDEQTPNQNPIARTHHPAVTVRGGAPRGRTR